MKKRTTFSLRLVFALLLLMLSASEDRAQAQDSQEPLKQAMELRKSGKYVESLQLYSKFIAKNPDNAIAHQEKGAVLASLNRYAEAISEENQALKIDPSLHLARIYKGMIYCNKERFLDAYTEFMEAQKLKPESYVVHMRLGLVTNRLKRLDEALKWYQGASDLFPDRAAPHMALSSVNVKLGNIDIAEEEAKLAVKLEPTDINYSNLGGIYSVINRLDEAESNLKMALAQNPNLEPAYVTLGRVYVLKGEFEKANEAYGNARKLSRKDREAYNALNLLNDKAIHRIKVVGSTCNWEKNENGYQPIIVLKVENVSSIDLSGKNIYFMALFENCRTGSKARARTKLKTEFKAGQVVEVTLKSRRTMHLPEDKENWPFVQCTVNCRVGEVSSFQAQYILDRLMLDRFKQNEKEDDKGQAKDL